MYDNIPIMGTVDLEKAPWNEKDATETITATQSYSFSYDIPLEVPEGLDDNAELSYYYNKKYATFEETLNYLKEHFKCPKNKVENTIKMLAEKAVIDDSFIDFY